MPLSPGQSLGHYKILAKLGEGGMGEVYEARDENLSRVVALKVLTEESARRQSRMDRFRTEAKAVASLNHPNIVQIYSVEAVDGIQFLTMERVSGLPLDECIPDGGMDADAFLAMATQLTAAVAAAHNAGVTHRDLKPANILIDAEGRTKVLDFGLAKMEPRPETAGSDDERTVMMTREGSVIGSAPYMSPEQARGETIDARSDLFSLGTVFYQALTGTSPFLRRSSVESQFAVIRSDPKPLAKLRHDLPPSIPAIVEKAMVKEVDHRYQTAQSMHVDLKELDREVGLASATHTVDSGALAPPSAMGSRWSTTSAGPRSRRRPWIWGAAAAVLVILGWLGWGFVSAPVVAGSEHQSIAVLPLDNLTGSPASDYLGAGIAVHLITKLSELHDLRVVGRSEAWEEGGEARSRQELARRLGVDMFLEGGVQRDGDNLRVSIQLTDARTNATVWGEDFVDSSNRLMDLQSEIARWVTGVLQVSLSRGERRRLGEDPTRSFQAYDLYLQGQDFLSNPQLRRGPELAEQVFRQATHLDPGFALAYVGRSESLWRRFRDGDGAAFLDEAEEAVTTAVELDPSLGAAQVARARILRERGEVGQSIAELQRAVPNHPKPAEAYLELGFGYSSLGEIEAAEESFRAATVLEENDWRNWNQLGVALTDSGKYDEAMATFERALEVTTSESESWVRTNLVAVQLLQGRFEDAAATFEGEADDIGEAGLASNLGTAFFFVDDLQRAELLYRRAVQLEPDDAVYHGNLGDLLARAGRPEEAREAYERAVTLTAMKAEATGALTDRLMVALYRAKAGHCDQALSDLGDPEPSLATDAHALAVTLSLCGTTDQAIAAARTAIDLGFPASYLAAEPEFSRLKGEPDFEALVATEG